jgi:hypothetical protein
LPQLLFLGLLVVLRGALLPVALRLVRLRLRLMWLRFLRLRLARLRLRFVMLRALWGAVWLPGSARRCSRGSRPGPWPDAGPAALDDLCAGYAAGCSAGNAAACADYTYAGCSPDAGAAADDGEAVSAAGCQARGKACREAC